jgi:hypothetical protein
MKVIIFLSLLLVSIKLHSQSQELKPPLVNVRLSFLVFPPFSPLLTVETGLIKNLTAQVETNFVNTHGINLKYFFEERMKGSYAFVGSAFIESDFLRKDKNITFLPYLGYGYAHRFGASKAWIFDSRLGLGATINADKNTILPVLKTGIGRTF